MSISQKFQDKLEAEEKLAEIVAGLTDKEILAISEILRERLFEIAMKNQNAFGVEKLK